ncbi:hypothetical protein RVR_8304 [Actinacidiphila reveromycinica]|uniref:Uncharacterized protein n=1 Tax=Actinacidiphila reveromycinica TaxID=659352 RepID=A0A7U3UYF4_9ACTN|nr:hypothetical protein [Streptomyces sp. SN-593]BBB01063.1 hypothetical protein RVR_8304 [Streptomyces sp. SN-593]
MPVTDAADYQWPTCTACHRDLRTDELGRIACRICRDRAERDLNALPGPTGLYAQLSACMAPGASISDGRAPAGRTAPLPVRLAPLDLAARGGVVTVLQTWLVDWHDILGWTHPRWRGNLQQQLDQVVGALRNNLDWASSDHPAFAEFADELAQLVRACRRQTTGERPERRIAVTCPCGGILRVTVSTPGARCSGCDTQYDRIGVLELPLAERVTAA